MTPAPHPLNCDTCKRRDKYGYGWCPLAWEHVNPPNTVSPVAEFTKRCGCASHSASSDVLEELVKLLNAYVEENKVHPDVSIKVGTVRRMITVAKKRQQTKEREQG